MACVWLFTLALLVLSRPAKSLEAGAGNQHGPCFLCGLASGALPPPGYYGLATTTFQDFRYFDRNGNGTSTTLQNAGVIPELLWVPNIPKILGASYGMAIFQPTYHGTVHIAGGAGITRSGFGDTVLLPGYLSWVVAPNTYVAAAVALYVPDGSFDPHSLLNFGDNYWTGEPNVAVSYLPAGWNLTMHAAVDFNTRDYASHTTSGNILYFDYTVAKTGEGWTSGIIGDLVQQFTGDRGPFALPNERKVGIGASVSRSFSTLSLQLYYVRDVIVQNALGGDEYRARIIVPF